MSIGGGKPFLPIMRRAIFGWKAARNNYRVRSGQISSFWRTASPSPRVINLLKAGLKPFFPS